MMNKIQLILLFSFISFQASAVTLEFLTEKLYSENLELKVVKNKIGYSQAQVKGAFSGHLPSLSLNNAASKGKNFESSTSSLGSTSVAPSGMDAITSQGSSSVGSTNTTRENEAWTSELSISVPIFSRFAASSSVQTAKNNLKQDELTLEQMKSEKKSQLIRLILEINILKDVNKTLLEASEIISQVQQRSQNARTRNLYNKRELLKLDTRYYELVYQKTRVEEGLQLAYKAMFDLIPGFSPQWFEQLPQLKISYQIPDEERFERIYTDHSLDWKKDTLQIDSTSQIYKATKWERPWVPMIVASGSYGYSSDFKETPSEGDWRVTLGVTFELFGGGRSSARRGQALHSHLITKHKRNINKSKKVLMLKSDSMTAKTSHAQYNHKMAVAREKKHKLDQVVKLSRAGTSTNFEQSVLLLDYAMAKFEAFDALKKYQGAILNIAKTLNDFEKVEIHETFKTI